MSVSRFARVIASLAAALLLAVSAPAASAQNATGRFEVYCDGLGFFLKNVDGAPAPGKLYVFSRTGHPGVDWVPKETWTDVFVFRGGCSPRGGCGILATGKFWLDSEAGSEAKRISGKYDIDLDGRHLLGQFQARLHRYRNPPRLCE